MKIAYIVPSLIRSGPIRVVEQLINGLSESDDVDLFYLEERHDRRLIDFGDRAKKIGFFEAIDFDRYDIVHSHTIKADAYLWWHRKQKKNAKIISTVHNLAYEDLPMQYGPIAGKTLAGFWGRMLRAFDGAVCLTQEAQKHYAGHWKRVKLIDFVYNGIQKETKRCRGSDNKTVTKRSKKKIGILASAGGVGKRKGVDQVIRALPRLSNYEVFVAGKRTKEIEHLVELSRSLGVENRVHFLGFVEEVPCWIEEMDVMVAPSRSEGFSLGLLDIVRARKPIVCSRISSHREAFDENEVSFFALDDIDDFIVALHRAEREGFARVERAYQRFVREYTTEAMVEKYRRIYRRIADAG